MTWWQILLTIIFTVPWFYLFFIEVVLEPIKQNKNYRQKSAKWDNEHPELQRRKCKACKYAISETYWVGCRYPNGIPRRQQVYCTLTKRKLDNNTARCIIAEPPTDYFNEPKDKIEPRPEFDTEIYYSAYGNCYHSTPHCRSIKNSQNIYTNRIYINDRYPCPKCWIEKDGYLLPKMIEQLPDADNL